MASASSEHIPLLQDDGQGLTEPQLPDVTDDITKAPRRFEQIPLVGAPAADEWEPTDALRDSIKKAIDASDAEDLRKALDGLLPEQTEKVLTTGYGYRNEESAIHYAAGRSSSVAVFEVLLHNRHHLLNLKDGGGNTPLHLAAREGSVGVVEKFVEWGGKELLEARDNDGWTPLHRAAWNRHVDVVEWMLRVNPQLLRIKNNYGRTPLDFALEETYVRANDPKFVGAMFAVAGAVAMELLGTDDEKLESVLQDPELLPKAVPYAKYGLGQCLRRCDSLGVDSLRWCSTFRRLIKSRQNDSLTDDLEKTAGWNEALTANFCSDTDEDLFRNSLKGKEREWFALLESAEPLTVVTQANCISLVTKHWQPPHTDFFGIQFAPRDVFITRVLSMLLMVAFVLLHIESIRGDSGVIESAVMGQSVWLWGAVLTGIGFVIQEAFQGVRLKAAYWADSWNVIDMSSSLAITAFIAVHFLGYSAEAEVSSLIVIALLFALRLLQTASLQPTVGPLILAVVRMFSDISMFLCLYVYILLVFAGVFTVLSSDEDHQYFGSFPKATLTLFYAGLGEFNEALTNAIESHDTLGAVLLFTYVILSSIILASTYSAIEETQAAQYQLLRIRVLNEYLTMPHHERLPSPFNLIGRCHKSHEMHPSHVGICVCAAVVVSEPLRYLASLISEQRRHQSALCRIAFWSMVALYFTVDGLLFAVAFTPVAIYKVLERLPRLIRGGNYWEVLVIPLVILLMSLFLLCQYAQRGLFSFGATGTDISEMADQRRKARIKFKDSIDKWIEAADHHDSSVPDVMAALREMRTQLAEVRTEQKQTEKQMDKRLTEMDRRQAEMEARMEGHMKEIKAKIK
ncbi:unnamed protein product [Vitrella brassicaformis CCMP3155]|uniref:Ion transport domain-containing protein n=1 Tax=Vitrella brassicaformis (strain CCMP3155) TaxID=1169540 RepID=A0A0G4FQW5_VITBC|nr:unnamed protein product [Vitrella brassicaformis CCMP3155]|eukprot:CEM16848.1 unnamed protein product [Vitrella brassicaformis CCMP3155]